MSRGVGVNEVRRCPSSLCLHVWQSLRPACKRCLSVCLFVCCVVLLLLIPAERQQLGHGGLSLPEPGSEPGHPVGPGVKEKYC